MSMVSFLFVSLLLFCSEPAFADDDSKKHKTGSDSQQAEAESEAQQTQPDKQTSNGDVLENGVAEKALPQEEVERIQTYRENLFKSMNIDEQKIDEALSELEKADSDEDKEKAIEKIFKASGQTAAKLLTHPIMNWLGDLPPKVRDPIVDMAKERFPEKETPEMNMEAKSAEATNSESKKTNTKESQTLPRNAGASTQTRHTTAPPPSAPKSARDLADMTQTEINQFSLSQLYNIFNSWADKTRSLDERPENFDYLEKYETGSSEYRDAIRGMAKIYATLHMDQRSGPNRDEVKYPQLLGKMTDTMRALHGDEHGGGSLERMWEWELSQAMNVPSSNLSNSEIIQKGLQGADKWIYDQEDLPNIAGANSIRKSWRFAYESLQAWAMIESISTLRASKNPADQEKAKGFEGKAKELINRWAESDYVRLRPKEGDPAVQNKLTYHDNQVAKWGKAYSVMAMRRLEANGALSDLFPKNFEGENTLTQLRGAMEQSLAGNLRSALGSPGSESGVGGSNAHTAMVFSALSALGPQTLNMKGSNLTRQFVDLVKRKGGKDDLLQYAPHRQLAVNETERSSAGRAVSFNYSKYLSDQTPENEEALLKSIENFVIYSGSLRAEVPRSGVHSGPDRLAPYYFHPALPSAVFGMKSLKAALGKDAPERTIARLDEMERQLGLISKSTWDDRSKSFLSPGNETYQHGGNTFSASLAMVALAQLSDQPALPEKPKDYEPHPDLGKDNPPVPPSNGGPGPRGPGPGGKRGPGPKGPGPGSPGDGDIGRRIPPGGGGQTPPGGGGGQTPPGGGGGQTPPGGGGGQTPPGGAEPPGGGGEGGDQNQNQGPNSFAGSGGSLGGSGNQGSSSQSGNDSDSGIGATVSFPSLPAMGNAASEMLSVVASKASQAVSAYAAAILKMNKKKAEAAPQLQDQNMLIQEVSAVAIVNETQREAPEITNNGLAENDKPPTLSQNSAVSSPSISRQTNGRIQSRTRSPSNIGGRLLRSARTYRRR